MAYAPTTFTDLTATLAGAELGSADGGTISVTINSSGTVVTLPVNGGAPDVISAISGERMSTFTMEYVADQEVAVPQVTQTEQQLIILAGAGSGSGYSLSCKVTITSVDTTVSGSDVMKVTLGMQSSGVVTIGKNP